jgi:tellurite resistance protein TerC
MTAEPWMWAAFFVLVGLLLAFDLGVLHRKNREIGVREALMLSAFYIVLALIFSGGVFHFIGKQQGYEFLIAYLVEKSLSLDNIFVFVLIFSHFAVPPQYQHRVLFWGILGAILMRGAIIAAGAALINQFSWILYVFGAFLVFTGIKMLIASDAEPDMENNRLIQWARRRFHVTKEYHGQKFFIVENGKRLMTPLFLVLLLVEVSDVIFAVDSIPAVFAVTQDPFIVFTSNIFAILGLRALYFALAAIIHRFEYLKYGLSIILIFIGIKMLVNHYFEEKIISTELGLGVTVGIIAVSMVISLVKTRGQPAHIVPPRGWVPGSEPRKEGGSRDGV